MSEYPDEDQVLGFIDEPVLMKIITQKDIDDLTKLSVAPCIENAIIYCDQEIKIPTDTVLKNVAFVDSPTLESRLIIGDYVTFCDPVALPANTQIGHNVSFCANATVGRNSVIGDHCEFRGLSNTINRGVTIGDQAHVVGRVDVSDNVQIGSSAVFDDTVTAKSNFHVGRCSLFHEQAFLGSNCSIGAFTSFRDEVNISGFAIIKDDVAFADRVKVNGSMRCHDRVSFRKTWGTSFAEKVHLGKQCRVFNGDEWCELQSGYSITSVTNLGSMNRTAVYFNTTKGVYVSAGCFFDTVEKLIEAAKQGSDMEIQKRKSYIPITEAIVKNFSSGATPNL